MTRISILEDQKAILEAKKTELENKRGDIYAREQQAISGTIYPFFSQFTPEVEIEITRGSVYFKMDHPDVNYKKELFNIYLRENWNFDGEKNNKSYDGVDLSYYTTSTKGINTWELKRLQLLGVVAEIVLEHQDRILHRINNIVLPFKAEFDAVYKEIYHLGIEIRDVEIKIAKIKKEKILKDLLNGGVIFTGGVNIQLKYNYCPYIKSIKLTDVSKSGKTATAVFTFAHGSTTSQEENVKINDVVDQVLGFNKSIVE
jgi:hypothetical protein